ncbi:hypothetical protein CsSME_00032843 [Camellia sinensis var. sinensis]
MFGLTGQPTFIENECMCQCQVPKGWDKLYVSLLSTETGKTVSKSGKASVRNGMYSCFITFEKVQPWDNFTMDGNECSHYLCFGCL